MNSDSIDLESDLVVLKVQSAALKGGLGAVSWAVLEMFRISGMPSSELKEIHQKMKQYFGTPTNYECNAILKVVENRLEEDKAIGSDLWYV